MTKELEENKNEKFTIAMSYDENTKLINKITIVSNKYLEQGKKGRPFLPYQNFPYENFPYEKFPYEKFPY